jgi:hypothetical protein
MEQIIDTAAPGQGPALTNTPQADLEQLTTAIKKAHAQVRTAPSDAIRHALTAGGALIKAKSLLPHGRWGSFLKRCDLGERQSARYMQLYNLWVANPSWEGGFADFADLSIERAIKKLSPAKARPATSTRPRKQSKPAQSATTGLSTRSRTTALDLAAAWDQTSLEERIRFISNIGLAPLLDAIPDSWGQSIEKHLRDGRTSPAPSGKYQITKTNGYPDVPDVLRRLQPAKELQAA